MSEELKLALVGVVMALLPIITILLRKRGRKTKDGVIPPNTPSR